MTGLVEQGQICVVVSTLFSHRVLCIVLCVVELISWLVVVLIGHVFL